MTREEFATVFAEQTERLHDRAFGIVKCHADAADILQDVYARVLTAFDQLADRYSGKSNIAGLLYRSVSHAAIAVHRQLRRRDFNLRMLFEQRRRQPESEPDPNEAFWSTNPLYTLAAMIDSSTPPHRRYLVRWAMSGGKTAKIARLAGKDERRVRAELARLKTWAKSESSVSFSDDASRLGKMRQPIESAIAQYESIFTECFGFDDTSQAAERLVSRLSDRLNVPTKSCGLLLSLHDAFHRERLLKSFLTGQGAYTTFSGWNEEEDRSVTAAITSFDEGTRQLYGSRTPPAACYVQSWRHTRELEASNELETFALTRFRRVVLQRVLLNLSGGLAHEWGGRTAPGRLIELGRRNPPPDADT